MSLTDNDTVERDEVAGVRSNDNSTLVVHQAPRRRWVWLLAGLIAGGACLGFGYLVATRGLAAMPERVEQAGSDEGVTEIDPVLLRTAKLTNLQRFLVIVGSATALVFAAAAGFLGGGGIRVTVGIVASVLVLMLAVWAAGGWMLDYQEAANNDFSGGLLQTCILHTVQWTIISVAIATAVGIVLGGRWAGGAMLAGFLGGALGVVIYVMGGAIYDPTLNLTETIPQPWVPMVIWCVLPPTLAGLVLMRMGMPLPTTLSNQDSVATGGIETA